jgi:hypothetical protein
MDIIIPASFDAHPLHRSKVEAASRAGLENADVLAMAVADPSRRASPMSFRTWISGCTFPRRPSNGP